MDSGLQECLHVDRMRVHTYEEVSRKYFKQTGRMFVEDTEPACICLYERDSRTGEFKLDKMRNIVPKVQPNDNMSQKEREEERRNERAKAAMEGLIALLRKRDTAGNIEKLQTELEQLAKMNNPLKKCLSMYKIKQKMDRLQQRATQLAKEKEPVKGQKEEMSAE